MRKVEQNGYSAVCVGSFGHAALKKFPYQLTAGHCKPSSGYTNTLYIWSGGGSGLTEDLEARSRGIRDGDTILLQCQSSGWSRSANNWLGFDGSNFMRCGSGATQKPSPSPCTLFRGSRTPTRLSTRAAGSGETVLI